MAKIEISDSKIGSTVQLSFRGDFQQEATGEIKPGSEVVILFDSERLPLERSVDAKGKAAWTISAFCQFAANTEISEIKLAAEKSSSRKRTKSEAEGTILKGLLTVPFGSEEMVIWFLNSGSTGNKYYDSAFGQNYKFPVAATVLEIVNGEIVPINAEPAPAKKNRTKKA